LVEITARREKGEIVYRVDCSNNLSKEELEYYLEEIVKGICKWKPEICESKTRRLEGTISEKKKKKPSDTASKS
jgi:hypothetical protein